MSNKYCILGINLAGLSHFSMVLLFILIPGTQLVPWLSPNRVYSLLQTINFLSESINLWLTIDQSKSHSRREGSSYEHPFPQRVGPAGEKVPQHMPVPTSVVIWIKTLPYHSSYPPSPPLSRVRPVPPTLALFFDFRPPNSLYISRMSTLLGRDTARASLRHCSSLISLGDW